MDRDTYEGLVAGLEAEAAHSPNAFRNKVLLISCSAYFALFAVLFGAALVLYFGISWAYEKHRIASLIHIGLFALAIAPVFFVVLRMFFMRLQPPRGGAITRDEAPKLFEVLAKMRRKLKGPPIHHVLINREYNAAIMQLPRWGLFGGHVNYLILGLPYLLGVTPQEMLATVAHEYGHLCGDHGKLGAWVYRQRRTFGALYEQVEANASGNWVHGGLTAALHRFMPYYNAYTFVLSRQNEYDADLTATELVGAEANANGLVRDALLGRWIHEDFWPKLFKQADAGARPTFMPFGAMRMAFNAGYEQWATQERLSAAWKVKSDLHDTHPALRDRVEATGQSPKLPGRVTATAAEALLGASAKRLIDEFDQTWWNEQKKGWESRYQYVVRSRAKLQELSALPLQSVPLIDLQEFALLKSEFESSQAAKPVLEHLLRQPGGPFPKAAYVYGRILLDEQNDAGLDHLEAAAGRDRTLIDNVARAGYYYLLQKRGEEAAQAWLEKVMPKEEME